MKGKDGRRLILFLHEKGNPYEQLQQRLSERGYTISAYSEADEAFSTILNDPPAVMIVSTRTPGWEKFMCRVRGDMAYKHLPLILLTQEAMLTELLTGSGVTCDDFLLDPFHREELLLRVQMREASAAINLDANPLTGLPGNVTIMSSISETIEARRPSALCYLDLDNFKAFNDRYGFARGDEAIRMTARVVTNVTQSLGRTDCFVGHVGGDDFFFIVPARTVEECCNKIIQNFDLVITTLIDDRDRDRGYIEGKDRAGTLQQFPLLSLSIAVIDLRVTAINHPGEAAAIAGDLKTVVKKETGSNFMVNRRKAATVQPGS